MSYSLKHWRTNKRIIGNMCELNLLFDFTDSMCRCNFEGDTLTIIIDAIGKRFGIYDSIYKTNTYFNPYTIEKICSKLNKVFSLYSCSHEWITIGDETYENDGLEQGMNIVEEMIKKELNTEGD